MITTKELLWKKYYAAVKSGKHAEAKEILAQIHKTANPPRRSSGGCSRCKKRFN